MPTNNFLQFNPNQANQETDAQYSADALRAGGLANPSIFSSALGNKLFYQVTTFIAAFAQSLATKNYNVSDASLANLAATLANVMTLADMAGYAPLANPVLTGSPAAPTAPVGDSSTKLATTAFVKNQNYAPLASPQFTGAPSALTPAAGDNSNTLATTAFVKTQNYQPLSAFPFVLTYGNVGGYQKLPSGLLLQWGSGTVAGTGATYLFPVAFPTAVFAVVSNDMGGSGQSGVQVTSCAPISNAQFNVWTKNSQGVATYTNIGWIAVGY